MLQVITTHPLPLHNGAYTKSLLISMLWLQPQSLMLETQLLNVVEEIQLAYIEGLIKPAETMKLVS